MRKPEFITLTGLDDRTDLDAAIALSEKYPIEWGVLFSPSQQGKPNSPRTSVASIRARSWPVFPRRSRRC